MGAIELRTAGARVVVDPDAGARLTSWTVDGLELLSRAGDAPEESGCYLMAPWAGRLRGNRVAAPGREVVLPTTYAGWAMHGTVLARPWEVVEADDAGVVLEVTLGADWPWPGRARATWHLDADGLHAGLEVVSRAGATFPAVLGWHPWFRRRLDRGDDVEVDVPATAVLERGEDHLPTGRRLDPATVAGPFDDAFLVPSGRAALHWPGALTLRMRSTASWVVVFDELPDHVCVEPQTGPPDGLSGPSAVLVAPGLPLRATTTWAWSDAVRPGGQRLD